MDVEAVPNTDTTDSVTALALPLKDRWYRDASVDDQWSFEGLEPTSHPAGDRHLSLRRCTNVRRSWRNIVVQIRLLN